MTDVGDADSETETVRLLLSDSQNEKHLSGWLRGQYTVERETSLSGLFDLAIADIGSVRKLGTEQLRERKEREKPVVLPILLIADGQTKKRRAIWEYVDDVVTPPLDQNILAGRIEALLRTRRLSKQLARQNERLDQFAGIISHDLRNPLNVASLHLSNLKRVAEDNEQIALDVEKIDRSLDRMEAIIDDVLTLTRAQQDISGLTSLSVGSVARKAWEHIKSPGGTLNVDTEKQILADESRLVQLFENLFRNATEHGDPPVKITVEQLADGFAVSDDGPGIDPDVREDIFEPGYTTNQDGTGLGLDIVEGIVTAHGWEIHVTDSEDGGARFEITGVTFDTDPGSSNWFEN